MTGKDSANPGKTALVTGASGGIGLELARLLAKDGYNLVLVARNEKALQEQAAEYRSRYGIEARVIVKDLTDPKAPEEIFDELESAGVKLEVLINNAGYATYGKFAELNTKGEMDMLQVNVNALTHLTRLFLPGMLERHSGKIMNLGSTASFQPGPLMAVYYASKAYVLSFSEAIANEVQGTGVTVTALCPGPTRTGFQERASLEESRLLNNRQIKIMDGATVARIGYEAMQKGKTVVIPGTVNAIMAQAPRFSPRKLTTRIVRNMQERAQ
ncbi:MAG TPA: SDR family oxidoreductase [Chloroflexia bacterium]|nr:SDR family oxidoreductase [Chloroflexia bacterium]